jgi:hypothetical protein
MSVVDQSEDYAANHAGKKDYAANQSDSFTPLLIRNNIDE